MDWRTSDQQQSEPLMSSEGSGQSSRTTSRNASYDHLPDYAEGSRRVQEEPPSHGGSAGSSASHSRAHSTEVSHPREKHRVRFGADSAGDSMHGPVSTAHAKPKKSNITHGRTESDSATSSRRNSDAESSTSSPKVVSPIKPLPSARRVLASKVSADITQGSPIFTAPPVSSQGPRRTRFIYGADASEDVGNEPLSSHAVGEMAAQTARTRAELLSQSLDPHRKTRSAPGSATASPKASPPSSPDLVPNPHSLPKDFTDIIPLEMIEEEKKHRKFGIDDSDSEDEQPPPTKESNFKRIRAATRRLVNAHLSKDTKTLRVTTGGSLGSSGRTTPEREKDQYYVAKPDHFRAGVLGAILHLYNERGAGHALSNSQPESPRHPVSWDLKGHPIPQAETPGSTPPFGSPPSSGTNTPKRKIPKWNERNSWGGMSTTSLSSLINSSTALSATGASPSSRPALKPRQHSSSTITGKRKGHKGDVAIQIRMHVEDVIASQEYLIKCCRALMRYGAPTHRLEEYMKGSARALEIDGQFLYIPGCMVISFDDPVSHTTQVKLVRESQGIDLGRLVTMHDVYKAVIHDKMGVHEASEALDELVAMKPRFNRWILIAVYGCASATVGPFAFGARLIDMPIAFVLGCSLGFMQLVMTAKSESYLNVFEITAAVVTSFLARAFGSINGGDLFCFPALAQSAIALILPGYMVLGAALELQSRNMVAGSVRMVYAIIYSLFLGFGITIGTSFYGAIDPHASQDVICRDQTITGFWPFIFVPFFTFFLTIINQARWRQMPVMIVLAFVGYVVNYFSAKRFAGNAQVANTLGALAVGVLGNIYSRLFQGLSAAAILPAIFVQVPSGLAASGSLISGLQSANEILSNGTQGGTTTVSSGVGASSMSLNNTVFNVGYSMIQIAVGLTVGLFISSLIVYPLGKKRSGLFSF